MSSEILDIFTEPVFDNEIEREQYHTYHPQVNSFNNNDIIEFLIQQQDLLLYLHDAQIVISGKFTVRDVGGASGTGATPADPTASCILTNNFGSYLFESGSYELNGKELERIRDIGTTSTLKGYLLFTKQNCIGEEISGWVTGNKAQYVLDSRTDNFSLRIPLRFWFNIFQDYKKVLFGRHKIRLVRARTDLNCFIATGNKTGTIKINDVALQIKHVIPNDMRKIKLLSKIEKNHPVKIAFRKYELHELPTMRTNQKEIWAIGTATQTEKPRYMIFVGQIGRKDHAKKDITEFDNMDITDVKLFLNSECYPYENLNIDFSTRKYGEIYRAYMDFQKSYLGKLYAEPLLTFEEFSKRALFVIDCSKQTEAIKQSPIDIKLEITSKNPFPATSRGIALLISDTVFLHYPMRGQLQSLVN